MKHEHPGNSDVETGATAAADAERSKAHAPVNVERAIVLFFLMGIAVATTGIVDRRHDEERLAHWTNEQAIPTVALISPRRGGKGTEVVLPGDVEAFYNASIHSQASGYIREWRKDIGAKVRKGEILAVVDTPELDKRIAAAESELDKAKANQTLARVTAHRWSSLRNSAAVSQQAIDEKESDANARNAEVEAAQANVERLKALRAFDNITAPFDGVVTARNVDTGSMVNANSDSNEPLFAVADIHQMRVYVRVPESYAAVLKDGMKAALSLLEYPDRTFEATIETTSHAIDKKARSLLVELITENKDDFLTPGAFARVHFEIPPNPNAVMLPYGALLFRGDAVEVAALGLDNRVTLKKVNIARDLGAEVEITRGLGVDERVVAHPPNSIGDGEEVRVAGANGQSIVPAAHPSAHLDGDHAKSNGNVEQADLGRGGE